MAVDFLESVTYKDAFCDLKSWIDRSCTDEFFKTLKINRKNLLLILNEMIVYNTFFMADRDNFELKALIPHDKKKKVVVKRVLSAEQKTELKNLIFKLVATVEWNKRVTEVKE